MKTLKEITNLYIITALRMNKFNKTKTAEVLGISRKTLGNKLDYMKQDPYYLALLKEPEALVRKEKEDERYLTKLFPTNEERLYYRDNFPNGYLGHKKKATRHVQRS